MCAASEKPVHQVTLSTFEMLETEVTEGQYQTVTGSNPSGNKLGSVYPLENVDWSSAKGFCEAIGGHLPSEAEWEYAARGGKTTRYYCGDSVSCLAEIAWYSDNSAGKKHAVRGKIPNAYGIYDILGNLAEWNEDWFHDSYWSAPTDGSAWLVPVGQSRGIRGGGFGRSDSDARASFRSWISPGYTSHWTIGLRCARSK